MQSAISILLAHATALYGGTEVGACRCAAVCDWGGLAICRFHLFVRRKISDATPMGLRKICSECDATAVAEFGARRSRTRNVGLI